MDTPFPQTLISPDLNLGHFLLKYQKLGWVNDFKIFDHSKIM